MVPFKNNPRRKGQPRQRLGQNITEYLILVSGVLVVVILAASSRGIFTQGVNKSLERMLDIECMSLNVCQEEGGCPYVCGNGCCEKHAETPASCPMDCECATDAECVDSLFCTVNERCVNSHCVSAPILIDDGIACTMDSCDENGDTIVHAPDNSVCDNALACDGVETCSAASGCRAGTPVNVDDGIACTVDTCADPAGTPVHTPNNAACSNGQFCDGSEVCNAASGCQAGTPPSPDDGVACTVDSCNEAADTMDHAPSDALCNDGQFCTGAETCTILGCQAGIPPNCSDGNVCNGVETCNAGVNACVAGTPLSCDDGDICNGVESCDAVAGCVQIVPPLTCSDNNVCNGVETCNAVAGCQAGAPLTCNDGNICNGVESCDAVAGCVQTAPPLTCSDSNVCNGAESCDPVSGCQAGTPLTCDDSDMCNGVWTCDGVTGCLQTVPPVTCSDNNVCNGAETCTPADGSCQAGTPVPISDGIACTDDNCDPSTGAVTHTPNNSLCPGGYCDAGSGCIYYQCLGSPSGTRCSSGWDTDDETVLPADTTWSPVSSCTSAGKCEYTCSGGTVYYNGACCTPACPMGSCGTQNNATTCGTNRWCGACPCVSPCGNGSIASGSSDTCWSNSSVQCGTTCWDVRQTATCSDGSWSSATFPSYNYSSCSVQACLDCTSPCGNGSIATGNPDTCYSASSVPCGSLCSSVSQTATCTNGSWSSASFTSYTNANCGVQACCVPKTCADLGLCSGSTPTSDGCSGTINCGACCGNGFCGDSGETCSGCPEDCSPCCGDGVCNRGTWDNPNESMYNCASDCGTWRKTREGSVATCFNGYPACTDFSTASYARNQCRQEYSCTLGSTCAILYDGQSWDACYRWECIISSACF